MDKIKRKVQNLSIKKTFIVLTILTIILTVLLSLIIIFGFSALYNHISEKYTFVVPLYSEDGVGELYFNYISKEIPALDQFILDFVHNGITPLLLVLFLFITILQARVFYRLKLKQPIQLLSEGVEKIEENDWDFSIHYQSQDEMGALCNAFETMRKELYDSNRKMRQTMEEQRRLNAAFSHDIRTPLTVLKGYTEFLQQYIPTGRISEKKLLKTIDYMAESVDRLEMYVETMNSLHRLEDIPLRITEKTGDELIESLDNCLKVLSNKYDKKYQLISLLSENYYRIDKEIIFQVAENLITNAFRYAKHQVIVQVQSKEDDLILKVLDDGQGFQLEDLKMALEPFYRNDTQTDTEENHLGLGLNICKILCQRHNGSIFLGNRKEGGAAVTAKFRMEVDKI